MIKFEHILYSKKEIQEKQYLYNNNFEEWERWGKWKTEEIGDTEKERGIKGRARKEERKKNGEKIFNNVLKRNTLQRKVIRNFRI